MLLEYPNKSEQEIRDINSRLGRRVGNAAFRGFAYVGAALLGRPDVTGAVSSFEPFLEHIQRPENDDQDSVED